MRFQVPQFIEVEDKIFGPLTIKQFIYLAGGAGLSFVLYSVLGLILGAIPILAVIGFSVALAFYKFNGRTFVDMLESGFYYLISNKLYIWKKVPTAKAKEEVKKDEDQTAGFQVPRLSESKLRDLRWSLDINESLNPATKDENTRTK